MKKVWLTHTALAAMLALLAASTFVRLGQADEPKKETTDEGRKVLEDKPRKERPSTAGVHFAHDLGLEMDSLRGLGGRIDRARETGDPVALASCANELQAAEQVSGKHASLKAADLAKEAMNMARHRNRPEELRLVAQLLDREADSKELVAQAEKTAKAQEARAKEKDHEKSKGIQGYLRVNNYCGCYVRVYVNFEYAMTVPPYSYGIYDVGDDAYDTTVLQASCPGHYWERSLSGPYDDVTWTLACP